MCSLLVNMHLGWHEVEIAWPGMDLPRPLNKKTNRRLTNLYSTKNDTWPAPPLSVLPLLLVKIVITIIRDYVCIKSPLWNLLCFVILLE